MSQYVPAGVPTNLPRAQREAMGTAGPDKTKRTTVSSPDTMTTDQIKTLEDLGIHVDASGRPKDEESARLAKNGQDVYAHKKEEDESSSLLDRAVEGVKGIGESIGRDTREVVDTSNIRNAISEAVPASSSEEVQPTADTVPQTVEEVTAEIEENGSPEEKKVVKRYSDATMSIQDAYANGLIDKNTRDYLIVDAIATFAKNLGRSIGNIGAQFTGGTIDNTVDESKWNSRQAAKWNQEQQMELENMINSPEWRQKEKELKSLTADDLNNQIKQVQANYSEAQIQQQMRLLAQQLDLGELNKEIMNGKITSARLFQEMQNNADSKLSQLGYGLLTTLAYGGNTGIGELAGGVVGGVGKFLSFM